MPNVSLCAQENEVHYTPLSVIIATDDTNLPLMNIARTYGWIKQDATEFYDSEANNVTDITEGIVNTFVNAHTQETLDTPFGEQTLDLWYDKDENKWYDATELLGTDNFTLANLSLETIRPIKSQDGETASLYEPIDWTNIEHFNEFKYFTSVTSIGAYAFQSCSGLTSVTIPNSVTSIGEHAFVKCSGLTSITIPDSVTSIGWNAFGDCSSLTSIVIPYSVTSIGESAFSSCDGLTSVTIGSGVTSIGDYAFSNCRGLTSIIIPNSVTSIGNSVFYGCSGLISVVIPNSVTSIGESAFSSCDGLTSVTIGSGVTSIGAYAFSSCDGLTSVTIPDSVTSIGEGAFYKCSGLASVTIGSGVTNIGRSAFYKCSGLASVTIEATIAPTITNNTFQSIKTNGTLTVPSGSSGYDVWMGTGDYYLGKYGWTKVEQ